MQSIEQTLARELNVRGDQVRAAVTLLSEGSTVPFIARYRKEKTGGLDDTQLRKLEERLGYLRQLEERRATILKSITEQGKLSAQLQKAIASAENKVDLEDIYAPFKQKRRTKGQIAREAGLEPLADALLANPALDPTNEAAKYSRPEAGIEDAASALQGAQSILVERIAEDPQLVGGGCVTGFGQTVRSLQRYLRASRPRRRNSQTTSTILRPFVICRHIVSWRYCEAAMRAF